ncbi:MAG TPA: lipocalin family protein [Flavobacterium sp.]|nr:lipocalin family protein [Flavobacterium sp.]
MKNKMIIRSMLLLLSLMLFNSCTYIPENAKPIQDFQADRYLGTWYEIARTENRFEKDMDNISAHYSLKDNGSIDVFNSGFNIEKQEWKSANGTAKFRDNKTTAALKVSFFGPFYSGYNVIALDEKYTYALVAGKDLDYLWILSREKTIPEDILMHYLNKAEQIGYDTSKLIWVNHDKDNPLLDGKK